MKRLSMIGIFGLVVVLAGGGYWYWQKGGGSEQGQAKEGKGKGKGRGGPVAVNTTTVKRQAMPVVIDAVGTVEADHSVAVRPQINGVLDAVLFKEGDYVKAGQVLFRIDPRPLRAALAQSQAAVNRDQAQLEQAQAQESRLRPLVDKEYITRQEYEVAATQSKSLEASVAANRAIVDQAKLQLAYAEITAPIAGRTGSLSVRSGNLVTGGGGSVPLVVINSTRPVLVSISVPQRHLDNVRKYWGTPELKVQIAPSGGGATIAEGDLVFIDNSVNPTTGTILLKARVKNDKEELWPGQFVSARIVQRIEQDAMTLPEGAIQPGQEGPFVFVVKDGRALVQNVTIDRQVGEQVVISKGLKGDERIVIEVPPTLTAGAQVTVSGEGGVKGGGKSGKKGDKGGKSKEAEPKAEPGKGAGS